MGQTKVHSKALQRECCLELRKVFSRVLSKDSPKGRSLERLSHLSLGRSHPHRNKRCSTYTRLQQACHHSLPQDNPMITLEAMRRMSRERSVQHQSTNYFRATWSARILRETQAVSVFHHPICCFVKPVFECYPAGQIQRG